MKEKTKQFVENFGLPRIIIVGFLTFLSILAVIVKIPFGELIKDSLVRTGMNGVLVLAMVPGILSGVGLNFGLPLGILCGLLGGLISIELDLAGGVGFFAAILFSIPFAAIVGLAYGWLLNKVKGSEMMVATYVGFSVVSLMNIGWMVLPFK